MRPISVVLQRLCACANQFQSNVIALLSTTLVKCDQIARLAHRFQTLISKANANEVSKLGQLHDQIRYQTSDVLLARHMDICLSKPCHSISNRAPCRDKGVRDCATCMCFMRLSSSASILLPRAIVLRMDVGKRVCVCVSACYRRLCKQKYHKHGVHNYSFVLRPCRSFYRISF